MIALIFVFFVQNIKLSFSNDACWNFLKVDFRSWFYFQKYFLHILEFWNDDEN